MTVPKPTVYAFEPKFSTLSLDSGSCISVTNSNPSICEMVSKPTTFLQQAQLDEFPLPSDILNTERGEDEIPQEFEDTLR